METTTPKNPSLHPNRASKVHHHLLGSSPLLGLLVAQQIVPELIHFALDQWHQHFALVGDVGPHRLDPLHAARAAALHILCDQRVFVVITEEEVSF